MARRHTRRRATRVRMAAKKRALNTTVANLMEAKPDPGSAAVKKAPNNAIKANIRIQPNICFVSPGTVFKAPFAIAEARHPPKS